LDPQAEERFDFTFRKAGRLRDGGRRLACIRKFIDDLAARVAHAQGIAISAFYLRIARRHRNSLHD
jgi:hypothetical protein